LVGAGVSTTKSDVGADVEPVGFGAGAPLQAAVRATAALRPPIVMRDLRRVKLRIEMVSFLGDIVRTSRGWGRECGAGSVGPGVGEECHPRAGHR
jgi:hypothetical protein